jgi:hypothetical protein
MKILVIAHKKELKDIKQHNQCAATTKGEGFNCCTKHKKQASKYTYEGLGRLHNNSTGCIHTTKREVQQEPMRKRFALGLEEEIGSHCESADQTYYINFKDTWKV